MLAPTFTPDDVFREVERVFTEMMALPFDPASPTAKADWPKFKAKLHELSMEHARLAELWRSMVGRSLNDADV